MVSSAKDSPVNNSRFRHVCPNGYVTRIGKMWGELAKFQAGSTLIFGINPKGVIYFTE
jgi:hypothetical protein